DYVADLYGVTEDDTILVSTPLHHSLAQRLVLMALTKGCTCVLLPSWSPENWARATIDHGSIFTMTVPAQLQGIVDRVHIPLSGLRCIVSSSAPLGDVLRQRLLDSFDCDLHECYGTTEVSCVIDRDLRKPCDGIGWITTGTAIKPSDAGTMMFKSDRTADNAPLDAEGYFDTGDIGRWPWDGDGSIKLLGRLDDVINVGGTKVWPDDVEVVVRDFPGMSECAAFPMPHATLGEVVQVAVVPTKTHVDERVLRAFCASKLNDAQMPHRFVVLSALPRNELGKLQRGRLKEMVE
ncbi:MAG: fatty acid--CoA ligase family protein, partial [Proteobacteria bacterium]|nr:fatty acid--CoA ligase family protein [Pseudomonadota bacterium]